MSQHTATWTLWGMLAISIVMTAEYARLCLTTEVASYRYLVLASWIGLLLLSLGRLVRRLTRGPEAQPEARNASVTGANASSPPSRTAAGR